VIEALALGGLTLAFASSEETEVPYRDPWLPLMMYGNMSPCAWWFNRESLRAWIGLLDLDAKSLSGKIRDPSFRYVDPQNGTPYLLIEPRWFMDTHFDTIIKWALLDTYYGEMMEKEQLGSGEESVDFRISNAQFLMMLGELDMNKDELYGPNYFRHLPSDIDWAFEIRLDKIPLSVSLVADPRTFEEETQGLAFSPAFTAADLRRAFAFFFPGEPVP